jgi:hypothetical protein
LFFLTNSTFSANLGIMKASGPAAHFIRNAT